METCGSQVNCAYRVLEAEVLNKLKHHNHLQAGPTELSFIISLDFNYPLIFKYDYAKHKKWDQYEPSKPLKIFLT